MTALDVERVRRLFPALDKPRSDPPIVFLDGPGGTQVPRSVVEAMAAYLTDANANSGGAFATSARSDEIAAAAHAAIADLVGAESADEITFGANMTTLTFHVSRAIGAILAPGDEIVVTTLDHDANVAPWRAIAADRSLTVRTVDIHPDDGTLDLESLDRSLTARTRLVAVGAASNAIGTINPVGEIARRAHAVGARVYVDAVHLAPHRVIDVRAIAADFLVCSAYKFFGPHVGALYGRADVLDALPAELYKVRPAHNRFETGTPNFEGLAGTHAAVEHLADVGRAAEAAEGVTRTDSATRRGALVRAMAAIQEHETILCGRLLGGLASLPGARVWGITDPARLSERAPTVAVSFRDHHPREVAAALGRRGIATWDGDFYAPALIERLGLAERGGLLRIGIVHYTTAAEIDRLLGALDEIVGR